MSSSILATHYLKGHWQAMAEGAASAGRVADRGQWRIARDVLVAETPELARKRALELLGHHYEHHSLPNRSAALLAASKIDPEMPDEALDVDYMMEHIWIVGDPEQCAARIRQLYQEVGGFGTLLAITHDPDDPRWQHRTLELLAEEVGPRVADLTG